MNCYFYLIVRKKSKKEKKKKHKKETETEVEKYDSDNEEYEAVKHRPSKRKTPAELKFEEAKRKKVGQCCCLSKLS